LSLDFQMNGQKVICRYGDAVLFGMPKQFDGMIGWD